MASASERSFTRRDTVTFLACLGLSVVALFSPEPWGQGVSDALRNSVLAPLVWLQARAEEGRTSRARLESDHHPARLRRLPRPGHSLAHGGERASPPAPLASAAGSPVRYVAAEVLHQAQATDGRTLLIDVGRGDLVSEFDPVVAPEGLIGMVLTAGRHSSVVMSWAHPEFRVSAFTVSGNAFGVVAPSLSGLDG